MSEVGETLRERRMSLKIDVNEVEEATKIRAKYLRALENEEYGLLPGHSYVKSFLRTYADYLGLDPRVLVDQYRAQSGVGEDEQLNPRTPDVAPGPRTGRLLAAGLLIALVLILLVAWIVGAIG